MDPFKYREVRGTFLASVGDSPDPDLTPDSIPLNGSVELTPKYDSGAISFTDLGVLVSPQPIVAAIVNGELKAVVYTPEGQVTHQALHLPVTVDERADQTWYWIASFPEVSIGDTGERVQIASRKLAIEDGEGPVDLTAIASLRVSGAIMTRGARGVGIAGVHASNGVLEVEYEDGKVNTVPMPDAVQGVGVEGVTQPSAEQMSLLLSDGTTTDPVALPPGPPGQDGSNVLPTDTAIANAVTDESSETAAALSGAMSAAIEYNAKYEDATLPAHLFGVVSSNTVDQSAVLQEAMDGAAILQKPLYLPPGRIRATGLRVPKNLTIIGGGFHPYYRRNYNDGESGRQTWIQQVTGATTPVLTIGDFDDPEGAHGGGGVTIENLMVAGTSNAQAPLIHQKQGFEVRLKNVLMYGNIGAPGLIVDAASNCKFEVQVQLCGSDDLPAVLFSSTEHPWANPDETWAPLSNSNDWDNLRVERAKNQSMWIGVGADTRTCFSEFTRMTNPHFEAPASEPNTGAMIEVGNVRSLDIVNPFFYGGAEGVILHDQLPYGNTPGQTYRGDADLGGITILGGVLLSRTSGNSPASRLVVLRSGNGFHAVGTKFWRHGDAAVYIEETYGPDVVVDSKQSQYGWDSETEQPGGHTRPGRRRLIRDERQTYRATAVLESPSGSGATVTVSGDDSSGAVTLTPAAGATTGAMLQVRFARPYNEIRQVALTPLTQEAALKGLYVSNVWSTGFQVGLATAPAAGQSVRFNYSVLRPSST